MLRGQASFFEITAALAVQVGKRVMFSSDQMIWPELIERAIESIEQAPFLNKEQRRDIFYNNAARFLRLDNDWAAYRRERASYGYFVADLTDGHKNILSLKRDQ